MKTTRVLFDLDGTLFDTQRFHSLLEAELLRANGYQIAPEEITSRYAGVRTEKFFHELLGDAALAKRLADEKWHLLPEYASQAEPLGDLPGLFQTLTDMKLTFAIGTASIVSWAEALLARSDIVQYFSQANVFGRDHVAQGKPDPAIWRVAACGVPAENCLVIEDGTAGIKAGLAFRSTCVLLRRDWPVASDRVHRLDHLDDLPQLISRLRS
jgi:beta-phosphoglucomutase